MKTYQCIQIEVDVALDSIPGECHHAQLPTIGDDKTEKAAGVGFEAPSSVTKHGHDFDVDLRRQGRGTARARARVCVCTMVAKRRGRKDILSWYPTGMLFYGEPCFGKADTYAEKNN